jgi:hypothetical protein
VLGGGGWGIGEREKGGGVQGAGGRGGLQRRDWGWAQGEKLRFTQDDVKFPVRGGTWGGGRGAAGMGPWICEDPSGCVSLQSMINDLCVDTMRSTPHLYALILCVLQCVSDSVRIIADTMSLACCCLPGSLH